MTWQQTVAAGINNGTTKQWDIGSPGVKKTYSSVNNSPWTGNDILPYTVKDGTYGGKTLPYVMINGKWAQVPDNPISPYSYNTGKWVGNTIYAGSQPTGSLARSSMQYIDNRAGQDTQAYQGSEQEKLDVAKFQKIAKRAMRPGSLAKKEGAAREVASSSLLNSVSPEIYQKAYLNMNALESHRTPENWGRYGTLDANGRLKTFVPNNYQNPADLYNGMRSAAQGYAREALSNYKSSENYQKSIDKAVDSLDLGAWQDIVKTSLFQKGGSPVDGLMSKLSNGMLSSSSQPAANLPRELATRQVQDRTRSGRSR
jgi:hypothetical protein